MPIIVYFLVTAGPWSSSLTKNHFIKPSK